MYLLNVFLLFQNEKQIEPVHGNRTNVSYAKESEFSNNKSNIINSFCFFCFAIYYELIDNITK